MTTLPDAMIKLRDSICKSERFSSGDSEIDKVLLANREWGFEQGWAARAAQENEALEVAVEALEFYGDYMNYSVDYDTSQNGFSRRCVLYSDIEERNEATGLAGRKAREALAEISRLRGEK